tara:strand:+ start:125 stop:583 length:459 start_codon:yes stop_codon:yes gene_type:complete
MAKLSLQEAALTGFTDVVRYRFGSDFSTNTTAAAIVKTFSVPAGTTITDASVHIVEAFAGPSITDVKLDIGIDGDADNDNLIDNLDVDAVGYAWNSGAKLVGGSAAKGHTFTADGTINIEFTPTGAGLSVATAGEVVIKFNFLNLNKSDGVN